MTYRRVYVEITGFCGLECDFCPPKTRQKLQIDLDNFYKISSQLASLTKEVSLHILGDPLSILDLGRYLDILHEYSLKAHITTTGFFLDRHSQLLLSHSAIKQINFSLNGFNGAKSFVSLDGYLERIFDFCDNAAIVADRFINLRLWNGGGEVLDDLFYEQVRIAISSRFGVDMDHNLGKRYRLANKVIFDFDDYFEWPSIESKPNSDSYCHGLLSQFGILSDGSLVPCCLDCSGVITLGNVFLQDITTILALPRTVAMMEGFRNKVATEELCKKCSYRLRFEK